MKPRKDKSGIYQYHYYCIPGHCPFIGKPGKTPHTKAKQHGESLKVRDQKTAIAMAKELDRQREELRRAVILNQPIPKASVDLTLEAFIDAYMEKHEALNKPIESTRENYRFAWLHFMRSLGSERLLKSLARDDMEGYYARAIKEFSIHTLYSRRRALNALFNDAVKRGWTDTSPMQWFPEVKREKSDIEVVDRSLLAHLPTVNYPQPWPTMMEAVYLAGCRISDMCKLKRRWIDRKERRGRFKETKENKTRYFYLTDDLLARLDKLERMSENLEYVVTFRGQPINRNQAYKHFIKIGKLLGAHTNPHKFRHSRATHFADDGGTSKDVANLLGHSSITTTAIYFHEVEDRQKQIAHLLSMERAIGGGNAQETRRQG